MGFYLVLFSYSRASGIYQRSVGPKSKEKLRFSCRAHYKRNFISLFLKPTDPRVHDGQQDGDVDLRILMDPGGVLRVDD